MKNLIGLGNIGKQYTQTRHNIGFIFVDWLKLRLKLEGKYKKSNKMKIFNQAVSKLSKRFIFTTT
mgnify:CR=1 FL=1